MFQNVRVLATSLVLLAASTVAAQTVDELIAKNITAHGGLDKLQAVQSIKMTGKVKMMGGMEAPLVLQMQRPGSMRMEMTIQGMTMVQAYDGQTAWQIVPFTGSPEPSVMSEDDAKEIKEQADMDGYLVDYQKKGHKVEFVGKEDVDGTEAYKLKVTLKDGTEMNIFLDPDTFLEFKFSGKQKKDGNEMPFEMNFGDFKKVGDVVYPHSMETKVNGQSMATMQFESIEQNVKIDGAIFKMPEKAK